jgi:Phage terminase small subunit
MAAGRPTDTPEQRALRVKAFDIYLKGLTDTGKQVSMRGIAMTLGVTISTVVYWRTHDKWDERVNAQLDERAVQANRSAKAVSALLRASFYRHIGVLNAIIADGKLGPLVRIKAISEFADICHKLRVIQTDDLNQSPVLPGGFKDDIHGVIPGRDVQPASATELPATDAHVLSSPVVATTDANVGLSNNDANDCAIDGPSAAGTESAEREERDEPGWTSGTGSPESVDSGPEE